MEMMADPQMDSFVSSQPIIIAKGSQVIVTPGENAQISTLDYIIVISISELRQLHTNPNEAKRLYTIPYMEPHVSIYGKVCKKWLSWFHVLNCMEAH